MGTLNAACPVTYNDTNVITQCEMRASHASAQYRLAAPPLPKAVKKEKWEIGLMVKGRNEPATISHVAHVIASVKGVSIDDVCEA